jgi:hypothetical protein
MTPLVTLLVIGLLLVVVVALLLWALVSPARGATRAERAAARATRVEARAQRTSQAPGDPEHSAAAARPRAVQRSNDELRGAKAARAEPKQVVPDDAFERFLRAGRDDDR